MPGRARRYNAICPEAQLTDTDIPPPYRLGGRLFI